MSDDKRRYDLDEDRDYIEVLYRILLDRPADEPPLVFGNLHTRRLFYFSPQTDELFLCKLPSFECGLYKDVKDPLEMQMADPETIAVFPELAEIIERNDARQ